VTRRRESRRPASPAALPSLGSVSQPAGPFAPGTEACRGCGGTDLVRIQMGAPAGRAVVFVSCRACERTGWFAEDGDGTPLTGDDVAGLPSPGGSRAAG
jgi:hypothetical protein